MGGNIFKDSASPIPRENIRPTLKKYIEHLGTVFPSKAHVFKSFHPVGSVGKKVISGDLDLALDFKHFFEGTPYNKEELMMYQIQPDEWMSLYEKIKSRARTSTEEMCKLKAFLKLIAVPIATGGTVHVANDKTTTGNLFTMFPQYDYHGQTNHSVQIDWMIGSLPWLKFAYHSGESGSLKGMHRTQLLVAMLSNKGYTFMHINGIKDKETQYLVATTPKEATELFSVFFGDCIEDDLCSFISTHHFLKTYSNTEEYKKIIKTYLKILKTSKAEIPMILKDYENVNA